VKLRSKSEVLVPESVVYIAFRQLRAVKRNLRGGGGGGGGGGGEEEEEEEESTSTFM
jgi:hypothetical protein